MNILKSIFKKGGKTYTPQAQADALLFSARSAAEHEMKNYKDHLTQMGIKIFDNSTMLELTIFYSSIVIRSIEASPIPSAVKEKIKHAMFKSYLIWGQSATKNKDHINDYMKRIRERLEIYKALHNMIEEGVNNNQGMHSLMTNCAKELIVVWGRILKENLDPENDLRDVIPLAIHYFESTMALSPFFTDEICKMNLSEEEYQKRKKFLDVIKKKSETEEGRRDIEKGLKAVEEYRKRQGNIR